jgi:REP element-mobilizing transposase RayT
LLEHISPHAIIRGMDRFWFLTWTTYGTWLPGDARGCVTRVWGQPAGPRVEHDEPGTPYDADMPGLRNAARNRLKCPPIWLKLDQATAVMTQFLETAAYRGWTILGASVMSNHAHIVVAVPDDPDPQDILGDFKSYASRTLNRRWGKPASETWWTQSGSKRPLKDEGTVMQKVEYVVFKQKNPLVTYLHPEWPQILAKASWLRKASGGRQPSE